MNNVQTARQRKAEWFTEIGQALWINLYKIYTSLLPTVKNNIQPCVRLNGTTDIRWELIKVEGELLMES